MNFIIILALVVIIVLLVILLLRSANYTQALVRQNKAQIEMLISILKLLGDKE